MYLLSKSTLYVILATVAAIIVTAVICNAESHADSVYFNSATDLIAKTDSVVGVCDTFNVQAVTGTVGNIGNFTFYRDLEEPIITCRELVSVVRMYPPIRSIWVPQEVGWNIDKEELRMQKLVIKIFGIPGEPPRYANIIPGQAVIWWREVE